MYGELFDDSDVDGVGGRGGEPQQGSKGGSEGFFFHERDNEKVFNAIFICLITIFVAFMILLLLALVLLL